MPIEFILNKKWYVSPSCVFDLKKVLKLLDRIVYVPGYD